MPEKILKAKAYGSIPHLPNSRIGPGDHKISPGQAAICTKKARDKHDRVFVSDKLDGSCCAVALVNGMLWPLTRAGYHANTSRYKQHHFFAKWVAERDAEFRRVLREGERLVGEWLAQAHGIKYIISHPHWLWAPFDLMRGTERVNQAEFKERVEPCFMPPGTISAGPPMPCCRAMEIVGSNWIGDEDGPEGVVYRVERKGKVDFLAKWVRPDKVDGKYLPQITGGEPVWNWNFADWA